MSSTRDYRGFSGSAAPEAEAIDSDRQLGQLRRRVAMQRRALQRKVARAAEAMQRKRDADEKEQEAPSSSSGSSLPQPIQAKMENSLGADFSQVKVFEGSHVSAMGAEAYSQGNEVHFAPGKKDFSSQAGQSLLGHELNHNKQAQEGRVPDPTGNSPVVEDASREKESDERGEKAARGEKAHDGARTPSSGAASAGRQCKKITIPPLKKGEKPQPGQNSQIETTTLHDLQMIQGLIQQYQMDLPFEDLMALQDQLEKVRKLQVTQDESVGFDYKSGAPSDKNGGAKDANWLHPKETIMNGVSEGVGNLTRSEYGQVPTDEKPPQPGILEKLGNAKTAVKDWGKSKAQSVVDKFRPDTKVDGNREDQQGLTENDESRDERKQTDETEENKNLVGTAAQTGVQTGISEGVGMGVHAIENAVGTAAHGKPGLSPLFNMVAPINTARQLDRVPQLMEEHADQRTKELDEALEALFGAKTQAAQKGLVKAVSSLVPIVGGKIGEKAYDKATDKPEEKIDQRFAAEYLVKYAKNGNTLAAAVIRDVLNIPLDRLNEDGADKLVFEAMRRN
jgi:hypothetical protein